MNREILRASISILFLVSLLSLVVPTGSRPFDELTLLGLPLSTWQNLLILLAAIAMAATHGMHQRVNPVLVAAGIYLLIGLLLSTRPPALSVFQSLRTFGALMVGPLLFEVRLGKRTSRWLTIVLPWLALLHLLVGVFLFLSSDWSFVWERWGAWRLRGFTIPAGLTNLGLAATLFALFAARRGSWWLLVVIANYAVITWTGKRAGMLEGALLIYAWLAAERLDGAHESEPSRRRMRRILAVSVPLVLLSYSPFLAARFVHSQGAGGERLIIGSSGAANDIEGEAGTTEGEDASEGESVGEEDRRGIGVATMGRLEAWRQYWGYARQHLWFGHGTGAAKVMGSARLNQSLLLPHNEYLRLLVDGGLVGLAVMLAGYLWMLAKLIANASSVGRRLQILAVFLVIALDALIENTLATQPLMIPVWLFLGLLTRSSDVPVR